MKPGCTAALLMLGLVCAGAALAQAPAAQTLEQLLDRVRQGQLMDAQADAERRTRFGEQRDRQQSALASISTERDRAQQRAAELEATLASNQHRIASRQAELHQRMGSLRELFADVTRAGGDLHATLSTSLTASQLGAARVAEIDRLTARSASGDSLPAIEDLEMLWFEWQREIIENGRVVKYRTDVIGTDGSSRVMPVVRIGSFGLITETGDYLERLRDTGTPMMLPRQPGADLPAAARNLATAGNGIHPFYIDASGGALLKSLADAPDAWERLQQGGVLGLLILLGGGIAIAFALRRLWVLHHLEVELDAQRHRERITTDNALGRLLAVCETAAGTPASALNLRLRAALQRERPLFERGLAELKLAGILVPLLGLFGTANAAFRCLHDLAVGSGVDYGMLAAGLGASLVTAIEGLAVALPLWLLICALGWRSHRLLQLLEQDLLQALARHAGYGDARRF